MLSDVVQLYTPFALGRSIQFIGARASIPSRPRATSRLGQLLPCVEWRRCDRLADLHGSARLWVRYEMAALQEDAPSWDGGVMQPARTRANDGTLDGSVPCIAKEGEGPTEPLNCYSS